METLAKIIESRLIVKLRPTPSRPILPLLAALCSGGVYAAEFPMDNPLSADAIRSGRKLFPDLVLGAGNVLSVSDGEIAISAGARYLTSPGYSASISKLCREYDVLYLPQCTTLTELLAVNEDKLSAVFLFAPHLWNAPALVDAIMAAFPQTTFLAYDLSLHSASILHSHSGFSAAALCGWESSTPESLVKHCYELMTSIDTNDS